MKWKWFWVSLVILGLSYRIRWVYKFLESQMPWQLEFITFVGILCSISFIIYFLAYKLGVWNLITRKDEEED